MVEKFNHLRIEDNGNYVICYLSNPPTHTLTSSGVNEIHTFLDQIEKRDDLRVLAFTGDGENVFIKHYEVGELANTAERNLETKKDKQDPKELHAFHTMLLRLRDLDAIVVAGINGNTAGGGCEFSLGCDLRIMADGNFLIGGNRSMGEYQVHMVKLQKLLGDTFKLKARKNDVTGEMDDLLKSLGSSRAAEND